MKFRFLIFILLVGLGTVFFLTQYGNSEKRAEKYYQSGLALLAEGDEDRAMIEFRNVFDLNGQHKEARLTYARLLHKRGALSDSYSQYLRLVEQYPNNIEGRIALGEMAIKASNWEEAERHIRAIQDQADQNLQVQAMNAVLDYRTASMGNDANGRASAVQLAKDILAKDQTIVMARRILIQDLLTGPDPIKALPQLEKVLEQEPENLVFHEIKVRLLAREGLDDQVGDQLKTMLRLFPDNQPVQRSLIAWYLQRKDIDGAETFLRQLAADSDGDVKKQQAVIQFLKQIRGPEAAIAELDKLIKAGKADTLYGTMRAALVFETGKQDEAISALEKSIAAAEPGSQTNDAKITLAKMLIATQNPVGARALVEEVLADDTSHVAALQLRANWQINDDKSAEAIITLRRALDQNPRDPKTLTLMAQAHERDGDRSLAGERLALAVEATNKAPAESIRYAQFLLGEDRATSAEGVLIDSLRLNNTNIDLLMVLTNVYMAQQDWLRTNDIIRRLRSIGTARAVAAANSIQTALLLRQEKSDESIAFLQTLIDKGDASLGAGALIVQTHLREGRVTEAAEYLDGLIAKAPEDPSLQLLRAGIHVVAGETDKAEPIYQTMIQKNPGSERPVQALYALLYSQDRKDEAREVLEAGITAIPQSLTLRWIKAGVLEKSGDYDGAIAIYEDLYAVNNRDPVIANNLASLIADHRGDAESLERAYAIARRLRETEVPAFQDTYGWIEYRRGNPKAAIAPLTAAAKGLPEDAMVQLHLGLTLVALNESEKAREALTLALELPHDNTLPLFETGREALKNLPPVE